MPQRVFVTRPMPDEALAVLQRHADVESNDNPDLAPDELLKRAQGCVGLVSILDDRVDEALLGALPDLKIVSNVAVGYDNIDVKAATAKRIAVTNTPGVLDDSTADFVFGLVLATARRIVEADKFARSGQWKRWELLLMAGMDVHGATLGIVGLGRIGKGVARRARGFGMRLLYTDAEPVDADIEAELGVAFVSKEQLLEESDIVTLHVPLLPTTQHYMSDGEFDRMKPTAIFINASRGPVVVSKALIRALEDGKIWAAGLDVFEGEPALPSALVNLRNVVLTPHIASSSIATRTRMAVVAAENVAALLQGKRPEHVLNPEVLESGP